MSLRAKYVGQRSFRSNVIVWTRGLHRRGDGLFHRWMQMRRGVYESNNAKLEVTSPMSGVQGEAPARGGPGSGAPEAEAFL